MSRPPVFLDLAFAEARERSTKESKVLVVDATAPWCEPCRTMDETTWTDRELCKWLSRDFVTIQLDVDADPETAATLRIKSMPTVLALRDGVELDRITGLRDADGLKRWLLVVLSGGTSLDEAREAAARGDLHAKMKLLRDLTDRGPPDEATELAVWLWQNMLSVEPGMMGVRHSFFLRDLERVVAVHAPARAAVERLRDVAHSTPTLDGTRDWISLNSVLGDDEVTLAWFAEKLDNLAGEDPRLALVVENRIVKLLVARERWSEVGRSILDPESSIRRAIRLRDIMEESPPPSGRDADHCRKFAARSFRDGVKVMIRGLLAAGRTAGAQRVEDIAREADDSLEMAAAIEQARRENQAS